MAQFCTTGDKVKSCESCVNVFPDILVLMLKYQIILASRLPEFTVLLSQNVEKGILKFSASVMVV